ncbi:hypothetical protein OSB04_009925 [Centaurea solstitialis]|uniref:HMA domain-containing protein n=1 Tax=Centaurea solstitialis TaxID=347529 RepID=A0AA38THE1_9ASTR|nr:hypothetical protein OSB04_009925 [Centaurea solstitialis]
MPESKKVVIKVSAHDAKGKRKVMKAVSSLSGIESVAMDMKDQKLTVIGDVDPVDLIKKLKCWHTEIVTVGPAKEEKKDGKKDEKKDEKKDDKKDEKKDEEACKLWAEAYRRGYYPYMTPNYCVYSVEENPNACVIC